MNNGISLHELARMGREMRAAQRKYFASRTIEALENARVIERRFDKTINDILEPRII